MSSIHICNASNMTIFEVQIAPTVSVGEENVKYKCWAKVPIMEYSINKQ